MFVYFFLLFAEGKVTSCKAAGTAFMRKMSVRLMSMYVSVNLQLFNERVVHQL